MLESSGFYERILDGWERTDTDNGIPYYINHKTKKTQWDHPFYVKSLEELGQHDDIKYAAYRTAMKIRMLQKKYSMDFIDLKLLNGVMCNHGYDESHDRVLEFSDVQQLVREMFDSCRKPSSPTDSIDFSVKADLVLNLMLNLYDVNRSGCMRLSAIKVCLVTLSCARLSEKYKYFFHQTSDNTNHIDRKNLSQLLHDLIQLPHVMNESLSFGGPNVNPAVDSCFTQSWGTSVGVTEDQFMRWLLQEPQTTVWLPTLHRLIAAESVTHETKCSICKANPISGLRYKCLKCFNYDMCQTCFFTGKTNKKHKVKHPTQEYCLNTSTKEDTKAFMRTVRNNFSKKHRHKNKPRYLPIYGSGQEYDPTKYHEDKPEELVYENASIVSSGTITSGSKSIPVIPTEAAAALQETPPSPITEGFSMSERHELASIIQHLEQENNYLMQQLECMYEKSHGSGSLPSLRSRDSVVTGSDDSDWIEKDKMDARQEVLEAHNIGLNKQLKRLRCLVNKDVLRGDSSSLTSHRRVISPLSINTKHSPNAPYYAKHRDVISSNIYQHSLNSDVSGSYHGDGQSVPSYHGVTVPRLHLSKLSNSDQYCATPVYANSRAPPKPDFQTPESCLNLRSGDTTGANTSEFQTPDSMNVDLTFGCIDNTMGRTHFTIATPEDSRDFRQEEEEMANLLAQLDRDMLSDMSKSELDISDSAVGEMLRAAAGIGKAFSRTSAAQRQTESNSGRQTQEHAIERQA